MGRVFEARHVSLGRPAAIKVLRAEHARNTHLIQRFFHEARAVNRINHAHIVEILDFVEETAVAGIGRVYCVMEMLRDGLTELLARERPSVAARWASCARSAARCRRPTTWASSTAT